jgi:anti-sigma regulatory factor (Ser/Thr protein kinase)
MRGYMRVKLEKPYTGDAFRASRETLANYWLGLGLDENLAWDLVCAADEIIANVIEHSTATWVEWEADYSSATNTAKLLFRDNGGEFDLSAALIQAEAAAGDGTSRHLGLLVVKAAVDKVAYHRHSGINEVEMAATPGSKRQMVLH